jgi:hypothetical protein
LTQIQQLLLLAQVQLEEFLLGTGDRCFAHGHSMIARLKILCSLMMLESGCFTLHAVAFDLRPP